MVFPANVLLEISNENIFWNELKQCKGIFDESQPVIKINHKEENLLRLLCGKKQHIEMSKGVISGGLTHVTEGPLKGMEGQICKIDRHKRLARIRMPEAENIRYILAGLEILKKSV